MIINDIESIDGDRKAPKSESDGGSGQRTKRRFCCFFECTCRSILLFLGLMFIVSACFSFFFAQQIMQSQVHRNIVLKPNSKAYEYWTKPPAKIYRQYFIFDVMNPDEIQAGTSKPVLKQRGPYTYTEKWEKREVDFLGEDLVTYKPVITLQFDPSMSVGNESDLITFINVPAIAMIETADKSKSQWITPTAINEIIRAYKTKLFVTKSVGELIRGYKDPLLSLAKLFVPSLVKDNKFSLLNGRNGTIWQNYTVMTGKKLASDVARIVNWNGIEKLDFWYTESANLINGTDGTYYSPFRTRQDRLYSFNPDMCRSYYLVYSRDNKIDGIDLMDFHLPPNIFYNSTLNPENDGFCDPKTKCYANGVQNISSCYGGVSGFVSQPHFLNADKWLIDDFIGLNPNADEHDFVLHFEPTTGVPITGAIRLQINFYLPQSKKIDLVKKVKPVLFPMFWFNDTYVMNKDITRQLANVALLAYLSNYIPLVLAIVGSLFWSLFTIVYIRQKYMRKCVDKVNTGVVQTSPDENASLIGNKV